MSADDQTREDVTTPAPAGDHPEALREQIEQTREELGDTVEALSAKADVKGQVKEKVDERKAQLRDQQAQAQAKLNEVKPRRIPRPSPPPRAGCSRCSY